ncbi:hypothetical protein SAMN05421837_102595 [Amycolatopsis pretoriensis]|uniref:Uncharacterized protein n=1 Tax=Amycolatopsis pretoriensis TaxID=218821 RepID=A0A1H5QDM2_9PSEU|nr:hypothetical protein [Amycolatopsis pretoriensis]SEF24166.1 hypothetical protein SAMN05421837_102595 [Amycolatopsis pretoriensis]
MVPFSITAGWERRGTPRAYNEDDVALWSEEMRALFRFVAEYEGPLTLHFGDLVIRLDLDDLPYPYPHLDEVFTALGVEGGEADLYFAAQGTELRLALRRTGDTVTVRFHPGHTAPAEFAPLAGRVETVDLGSFISAWNDLRVRVRAAAKR